MAPGQGGEVAANGIAAADRVGPLIDQQGRILRSPAALKPHQAYHIQLAEGSATAELASVQATLE